MIPAQNQLTAVQAPFHPLLGDTGNIVVFFLNPEDAERFSRTCKRAFQIVSNFWNQKGVLQGEFKHCLLAPVQIHNELSPVFDDLTFKLPLLLSSQGMTYKDENGAVKNAKCVYNWENSTLYFRILSNEKDELIMVKPNFLKGSKKAENYTIAVEVIAHDGSQHFAKKSILPSLDYNSLQAISGVFFQILNADPIVSDDLSSLPPITTTDKFSSSIVEGYIRENAKPRKFQSEPPLFPSLTEIIDGAKKLFNL